MHNQEIYIYIDDSSVFQIKNLMNNPKFYYSGLFFASREAKEIAEIKYLEWEKYVRCLKKSFSGFNYFAFYCKNHKKELKGSNLKNNEKKLFFNLINSQWITITWIADIRKIFEYNNRKILIKNQNKITNLWGNSKDILTYKQYAIKRIVKEGINKMILQNQINPNKKTLVKINIDYQNQSISNAYYQSLEEWVFKELIGAVNSLNNNALFKKDNLKVKIQYLDSKENPLIRAADVFANANYKMNQNLKLKTREKFY